MTLLWIAVAIAALVGELLITNFLLLFFAIAALVAAALAALGLGLPVQLTTFFGAALFLPIFLRRGIVRRFSGRGVPSRTDTLVGTLALVTEAIDPVLGTGRVNAGGEDWAARWTGTVAIGAKVTVLGADGIVLLVSPVASPHP
ncbi:MAG TPA: NfeD family protein [Gemmatimonadales bacterium]|jgi:membrane protein implicated in regulation of membrane protease activity|nr:NfeD family protein [Gemmatimonadales bacterium]